MLGRKKRHPIRIVVVIAVLLLGSAVYINSDQFKDLLTKKAATIVAEKLLEDQISQSGALPAGTSVKEILNRVDKKDMDTVTDIVKDKMTNENVQAATQYVKNKDMTGLKEFVKGQLTDTQKQEVKQIYEKYKNQIP
ncbi:MAG: hypothetical protein ACI4HI_01115 [Lachnospiraceae bacterium]